MMNEYMINGTHDGIRKLLDKKRIKTALDKLGSFVKESTEWKLQTEYDDLVVTYKYLLDYYSRQIADPERISMYYSILKRAYILNDKIMRSANSVVSGSLYYFCMREDKNDTKRYDDYMNILVMSHLRIIEENKKEEKDEDGYMERLRNHEICNTEFFKKIWVSPLWDDELDKLAHELIAKENIFTKDKALFVSAVTMGALQVFDIRKYLFLMNAYNHCEPAISQRALVGIVLLSMQNNNRLECEPEVIARMKLLSEQKNFERDITQIQIQLLLTRETKKAQEMMHDEILPELVKNGPQFGKMTPDELSKENDPDVEDQEKMELRDKAKSINKKLNKLGELEAKGVDVHMFTFAQLKGHPYFNKIGNWFYPFDKEHSMVRIKNAEKNKRFQKTINFLLRLNLFCNSDKYSLYFLLKQLTNEKWDMDNIPFMKAINLSNETLDEAYSGISEAEKASYISQQYIQDLYRFFKLHPHHKEFNDIFDASLNIHMCCPILKEMLSTPQQICSIADYLFSNKYYSEALSLYQELLPMEKDTADIYKRIGYCYQKMTAYQQAVEAYTQADVINSDDMWTVEHIAMCYRMLRKFGKAVEYYKKVEETNSENLNVLLTIGMCLAELKRYDEAFNYFFKVEYLDPKSVNVKRAIAWCSFLTNKLKQAEKYYNEIFKIELKRLPADYMNAGHVKWCKGDISGAINKYIEGCAEQRDTKQYVELMLNDKEELLRHGVVEEEFEMMIDIILGYDDSE